jgi:cytochrome c-type biogenesis protein CcmH/NrfG
MAKESDYKGYVKTNTMLLASIISLAIGFLGGIVLSAYKSTSVVSVPPAMPPQQQAVAKQGPGPEEVSRILTLEKEVAANPDNKQAWIQLGNLYFDTQQVKKAISAYEKSLSQDPNNADVQTDLGVMYRRNGQPQKAIEAFDRAIQVNPRHEISRFNKGIVLMHDLNDVKGAAQAWEDLVKLNPQARTPNGLLISDMLKKLSQSTK